MENEEGYCGTCGCALADDLPQLTMDGTEVCASCVADVTRIVTQARRPEARDDGR